MGKVIVTDNPNPTVPCCGCGEPITIREGQSVERGFFGIVNVISEGPCLNAPYICSQCRRDRHILAKARKMMNEHFGSCERKRSLP